MGLYLNNSDIFDLYKSEVQKPYFIDKSMILQEIFPLVEEGKNYICITRPRRFGKTVMANMIASYFSKNIDARQVFDDLRIADAENYEYHINKHNVIYIDFSKCDDECEDYHSYISNIKELLREDLHASYPECAFRENGTISEDLIRIFQKTEEKFIFVLDEWDAVFHMPFVTERDKERYLLFLKGLLKDQAYVSFAFMTGILPIAKYSSGSELNMFMEFTMARSPAFCDYYGFTESEVDELYKRYEKNCQNRAVTREGLRVWYDGYQTATGEHVYNPRSIVSALRYNNLTSYWTSSGPYDEIFYYIRHNIEDVRDALAVMLTGEAVPAKVEEYAASTLNLKTKDEIFSAMVVYGFLSYENGKVSIPNKELMDKFTDMVHKESSLGYVHRLSRASERMIKATLDGNTDIMEEILDYVHDTETPLLQYNNETELTAIVNLAYLSARDIYDVQREDKSGIGYVDFIFYPKYDKSADCIILELKVNHTPEEAIKQIRDKKYLLRFRGKMGEIAQYTGRILAVGIGYDKQAKKHFCKTEAL